VTHATVRRPRLITLMCLLLILGALSALGYGRPQPARAVSRPGAAPAALAAAARRAPLNQICSAQGSSSLCANRNGGGTSPGTPVIAWSAGDNNDDFQWLFLSGMCNHGTVSTSPACPFTNGGGLNSRYAGRFIAEINWIGTSLCVANDTSASGFADLGTCPDFNGNGGANGTIFVLPEVTNPMNPATTFAVNRYWSDNSGGGNGRNPRWMCVFARGVRLWLDSDTPTAGACQWNQLGSP
jgi:hypothetical protein